MELRDVRGIGRVTLKKLVDAGITTVRELIVLPPREIAELTGLPESRVRALAANAREMLRNEYVSAEELDALKMSSPRLTTGVKSLDRLLGGIEGGVITEFAGEYGSGKTQLCHQLSVTVQLPERMGGLERSAIYVDTEGTFSTERIKAMAKRFGLNVRDVLRRIYVVRAYNSDHQIEVIRAARSRIPELDIGILIVDSLINHFRSEYPGRENLAVRQQRLKSHLQDLMRIAEIYSMPVIFTNQIVSSPDPFSGMSKVPAGGNVVAHSATYRIFLGKKKGGLRYARIIDSPKHPEGSEAYFRITDEGVVDVDGE